MSLRERERECPELAWWSPCPRWTISTVLHMLLHMHSLPYTSSSVAFCCCYWGVSKKQGEKIKCGRDCYLGDALLSAHTVLLVLFKNTSTAERRKWQMSGHRIPSPAMIYTRMPSPLTNPPTEIAASPSIISSPYIITSPFQTWFLPSFYHHNTPVRLKLRDSD